jgi:DNA gyrase subunit A
MTENEHKELIPVSIEQEMKKSYLDYAMSVIVSRAIPDLRDGLKPVHRRILFSMSDTGAHSDKPYRKSARIVGDVMGKYHPHGDSAIYDALVRMAQDFSMGAVLIDGQGNYGSLDGDPPAAMRYTEARMAKLSHFLVDDLDKETVEFQDNYDGSEQEPMVLPAKYPNILVNGANGIAVGMATNMPTHNLGEVIDGACALIDNPEMTIEELIQIIPGPDFPTGGQIIGRNGCRLALTTGRGSVIMRGRAEIEELKNNRQQIIITEIPYQVNKSKMVERIADLVREKRIEGISDLRDESNRDGIRVVIEIKRDASADVVLNQIYSYTPLQSSFGVNSLVLADRRPQLLNVRQILGFFIKFREEVVTRRTRYLLGKAREKAHLLLGLAIAVANIDEIIELIKASPDPASAREALLARTWNASTVLPLIELVGDTANMEADGRVRLTEAQARAILELRLQRLTGLERDKIDNELRELAASIQEYLSILADKLKMMGIIKAEMLEVKEKFAIPRRTEIVDADGDFGFDIESLIEREEMVVTVTMTGYIKRVPLSSFRAQKRGGKGKSGMTMKDEDVTTELFVASTHTPVLFFSNHGKAYRMKVYQLPQGTPQTRGKAIVNLLPLAVGEKITTFMPLPEDAEERKNMNIFFATSSGNVRRNDLSDFESIQSNGKIAIRLDESDRLVGVVSCKESDHILLATKFGKAIRFQVESVRVFKSRTSDGVRGIKLGKDDEVISMCALSGVEEPVETREEYLKVAIQKRKELAKLGRDLSQPQLPLNDKMLEMAEAEEFILTITANGFGKRSSAYEYRITNRGGSGIINIVSSPRNGEIVASFPINELDEIMLLTNQGRMFRCPVSDIRITGRNTQGVIVLRDVTGGERVVSAVKVVDGDEDEEGLES